MSRPRMQRFLEYDHQINYFKPVGTPLRELEEVEINFEELESLRLRHLEGLDQKKSAEKMKISPSTYQRSLYLAYEKIVDALVNSKAIKIDMYND